jgi:hypothetical protein
VVLVELDDERCPLRSGQLAAKKSGSQHVVNFVGDGDHANRDFFVPKLAGGAQALPAIENNALGDDLDRHKDAARGDVCAKGLILGLRHNRDQIRSGVRRKSFRRAARSIGFDGG